MRIMVTGANGLLGYRVAELGSKDEIIGTYHSTAPKTEAELMQLDIRDRDAVMESVERVKPDAVIHCAAYTDVDGCEANKEVACDINVNGTKNIADACAASGARLVFVSTDYVFDGEKGNYTEADEPNPINYYGSTKKEAEKIAGSGGNSVIARPSVIYGSNANNFVLWVMNSLKHGKTISAFSDQINTPTFNEDLAKALLMLAHSGKTGIYHAAGPDRLTRMEFAKKIANAFGLDANLINSASMQAAHLKAKRPQDSSLNTEKIKKDFAFKFYHIDEALRKMVDEK